MTDQTLTTGRSLSEFTAQLASAQPAPGFLCEDWMMRRERY